jgi:uncharacterized protein
VTHRVLLDTSFLIALENRSDPHHRLAKDLDRKLFDQDAVLVLHWGILLEIGDGYARLGRRHKAQVLFERFIHEDRYQLEPLSETLVADGLTLYLSRPDKEWGLTDCLSFELMRAKGITEALTADVHFSQAGFQALLLND